MTKKSVFTRALLSLAIGASLAVSAATAQEKGFILDEHIHDYSVDASRSLPASPSRQDWSGYNVKIVLDESYHDYYDADTAAFESKGSDLERAEFAAFEEYSSSTPWVSEVY